MAGTDRFTVNFSAGSDKFFLSEACSSGFLPQQRFGGEKKPAKLAFGLVRVTAVFSSLITV